MRELVPAATIAENTAAALVDPGEPLLSLARLAYVRDELDRLEADLVFEAIDRRFTWAQVANALRRSRTATYRAYAATVSRRRSGRAPSAYEPATDRRSEHE